MLELGLNPANLRQRISNAPSNCCDGLVDETRRLSERYGADLPLLQTIGYGEALQVIGGSLSIRCGKDRSQRTRQFAKRQRTWFRRRHNPQLADQATLTDAMTLIEQHLKVKDADVVSSEVVCTCPRHRLNAPTSPF